jgi:hypothetical protein
MSLRHVVVVCVGSLLMGCANSAYVEFLSEPPEARVYDDATNELVGVTPTDLLYLGDIPGRAYSDGFWDPGRTYTAYREGYLSATLHPVLGLDGVNPGMGEAHTWTFRFDLLPQGSPLPYPPGPPGSGQQQQQQQQTVVIPGAPGGAAAAAPATGAVMVSCPVDAAEVYVDGMFIGNAPARLVLKEGIHIIEVRAAGHGPFRRELRVTAGSEVPLRATLPPE